MGGNGAVLDVDAVQEAKAIMKAKFPIMVQYFIEDSETYIANIREGVAQSSVEKIVSPAHTLKSSARQIGAVYMSDLAKEIETIARAQCEVGQGNMAPFIEKLSQLEASFLEVQKALHQEIM